MRALRQIEMLKAPAEVVPSVLEAAKVVVALSGWSKVGEKEVYATSMMAVAVLQAAIVAHENPSFRLAPEPVRPGLL